MNCASENCTNRASHVLDVKNEGMAYVVVCEECASLIRESGHHVWRLK